MTWICCGKLLQRPRVGSVPPEGPQVITMTTFLRASSLVGVAALVAVLCSPLQVRTAETRTPLVRADHFDAAEDRTSECVSGPPPWTHVALWIAPDMPVECDPQTGILD